MKEFVKKVVEKLEAEIEKIEADDKQVWACKYNQIVGLNIAINIIYKQMLEE